MKSKVALVECTSYDLNTVKKALKKGLDLIGGINSIIPIEHKILLKPNLLNKALPEKAVTTHPAVFESIVQILQEDNYSSVFYGDSPGNPLPPEKIAESCGLKAIGDKYNLPFGDFTHGKTIKFPEGRFTKQFEISNGTLEADSIINICKMKTHGLMRLTGAVKNLLGCVYGFNKGMSHAKFPDTDDFGKMLVDLNLYLPARLHIMDGIVAMEGNGPFAGTPVPMNVLLISTDPVALDSVFARLVNVDPLTLPTVVYGEIFGLGKWKDEEIEIVGDPITPFINKDFDVYRGKLDSSKWSFLTILRSPFIRKPVIKETACIGCGDCVKACPIEGKAVDFKDNKKIPSFNYKKCIRCYCCQEMCPAKAIEVKTPLLGSLFIYRS